MEENVKKFQRLDLEVQKVKKFPQYLCRTFDCDKAEEPNLAEEIQKMNDIKANLTAFVEATEHIVNEHKRMKGVLDSMDEKLKETLREFKPHVTSKILQDYPDIA